MKKRLILVQEKKYIVNINREEIIEYSKKYAREFDDIKALISYITEDIKNYPLEIQEWYYNFSYFELGNGLLGNCILLGEMDSLYPDEGFDLIAHKILSLGINREMISKIDNPALWAGLSGICWTIQSLSKNFSRYTSILEQCETMLKPLIKNKLIIAFENLEKSNVRMTDYDLIEGLSGIVIYLATVKDRDKEFNNLFNEIMDYFIALCDYNHIDNEFIPRWHIKTDNQFLESEKKAFPEGNFNLGHAHGMSGVLSALSLYYDECTEKEKIATAIVTLVDWFIDNRIEDENYTYWEKKMPLTNYLNKNKPIYNDLNFSWCYGDFTIIRSIWLAGRALKNDKIKDLAISYFESLKNNLDLVIFSSPTYCHGYAGALHILMVMKNDTGLKLFDEMAQYYLTRLIGTFDKNFKFGFRDVEQLNSEIFAFDKTGFLTGASGIYLVLLDYVNKSSKSNWQSLFLLR